ncbi:MAG: SAM hydrolase/SAM-dependent halogenase family protein [Verrucomicrobiota bacterium]
MNRWRIFFFGMIGAALFLTGCGGKEELRITSIALFTDRGEQSLNIAQLKGAIKSINPDIEIIDLIHSSESLPTYTASYLLDKCARYFPAGTVFVVDLKPDVGASPKHIVVRTKANKFYVGADNTIFTRVIQREGIQEACELNQSKYFLTPHPSSAFLGRDVFGPIAAHISLGKNLKEFGAHLPKIDGHAINMPTVMNSNITGEIVHIDSSGDIITNIQASHVSALKPGQLVRLMYKGQTHSIPFLQDSGDINEERLIALLNCDGELEIAFLQKNAASFLKAKPGDSILIKY